MKVIYLHQYFNTPEMPGATRSFELARRLVAAGHEVEMITTDRAVTTSHDERWRESNESGIAVHWARVPYSNQMGFAQRVRAFVSFALLAARKARQLRGDVVYATSTPLTIAIPAIIASRRLRIPMVFEVRDLWPAVPIALGILRNPVAKWLARRLEKSAYRNSTQIVALAPGMKEEIRKSGYRESDITVIPNGCDISLFDDSDAAARELRRQHDWLQQRPLLAYVGTIGRINAVDYLVDIAKALHRIDSDIRIVVVGAGVETARVKDKAERLAVLGRNFFMIGQVPKKEAAAWTRAATANIALVHGPRFIWKDATQNKFFDSLAAGRPVISNYDGWQAEVAEQAGAGVIVAHDDSEAAARQIANSMRDEDWLASAAVSAAELARGPYSRDVHAKQLEQVLRKAVGVTANQCSQSESTSNG